jgi:NADH-quinone oxidoreductase subunit N
MAELQASLRHFLPESLLTGALLLVILVDLTRARARDTVNLVLTLAALAAAFLLCVQFYAQGFTGTLFGGMLALDPIGIFFKVVLVLASFLVILMFQHSREMEGLGRGEFYALMLALTISNMLMATASDLAMLYLSLEMVSITSYILVGYMKGDRMSNEASLKYILFGAASTGVMLYGLSLLYGLTGTTSLPGIREVLAAGLTDSNRLALYVISLLIFAGFGFKTALVPFHFWCPDVYQGAPTPVTAFLSVAPKAAGFSLMLRFFFSGLSVEETSRWDLSPGAVHWPFALMVISVASMTLGNVAALTQTNMKRLLAYSSIAHAGYILMGIVALSQNGARGLIVYVLAYLFMNLGAFLVVTLIHHQEGTFDLRDYPGMYRRAPFLTVAMAIFLFSLMGIPPLVGFMGKFYVFGAIVDRALGSGADQGWYRWYAIIAAVNAAVAAYYYARVLKTMIIDGGGEEKPRLVLPASDFAWILILVAANVVPLLFWSHVEGWAQASLGLYAGR